jgi:hypothetical protein
MSQLSQETPSCVTTSAASGKLPSDDVDEEEEAEEEAESDESATLMVEKTDDREESKSEACGVTLDRADMSIDDQSPVAIEPKICSTKNQQLEIDGEFHPIQS